MRILSEPISTGSMQIRFRVKARRCNLSHELEAHSLRRSRQEIRVFATLRLQQKHHAILGKGLNISLVVHSRCSSTASAFGATATTARFLPEVPSLLDNPHWRSEDSLPPVPENVVCALAPAACANTCRHSWKCQAWGRARRIGSAADAGPGSYRHHGCARSAPCGPALTRTWPRSTFLPLAHLARRSTSGCRTASSSMRWL